MRNPRLLKPFGLPTERLLTEHRAAVRRLGALPPSLRGVAAFDDASARGGLIPRGLAGALAELGMDEKEAQGMADEILERSRRALSTITVRDAGRLRRTESRRPSTASMSWVSRPSKSRGMGHEQDGPEDQRTVGCAGPKHNPAERTPVAAPSPTQTNPPLTRSAGTPRRMHQRTTNQSYP